MRKNIPKIQYITQDSARFSHSEQARLMFEKGIECVQIRMKNSTEEEILTQAKQALQSAKKYGKTLIINDSIEIAKEIGAHGVHLGLSDTPINEARDFLGDEFIIGGTTNTIEDIQLQQSRGANYVGLGPFKHTTTKKNISPIIGLNGYKEILFQMKNLKLDIPIIAVGGIQLNDIETLTQTGLYGVALSGALLQTLNNHNTD
ncbi:thiamine phosphate synthase [Marinifilum sp. N1E240]|uniref:thiamine phosphate synthase n=1 Tax=Marinifilum sp. N1E240 TaxID=2608082 RepID=UPI00128C998B|nr:thiamine phosphate synthase [Marinifilum sp. N1E240]MPQ46679.1 thiamine phosphate synthase [Marinifilum sp. N1E240]